MREIKFRAWDKTEKVMLHWDFIEDDMLPTVLSYGDFIPMQYTGLKDRHGKEIYEGDIVICRFAFGDNVCEVVYNNGRAGFFVSQDNRPIQDKAYDNLHWHLEGIEVIGNIYENLELLNPHTT